MAGDRDDVARLEDGRLPEDVLAHLGERQPVAGGIEVLEASGGLDRLERHAAHAGLLEGEVDDLADLVVVHALLQRDDERRRDVALVQVLERPAPRRRADRRRAGRRSGPSRSESNCR